MASEEKSNLSPAQLAELSALADGTLDAARRPGIEARIAASPGLRDLFERERHMVELLHEARAKDGAPQRLRARIEAQRLGRPRARGRRGYGVAIAGVLAVAALALALALPAGTPGSPSVSQAAALALGGPSRGAPGVDASDPQRQLAQRVQDVYFPNWSSSLGWRAVGVRSDLLDRRPVTTVFYRLHGDLVAYAIVSAPALTEPGGSVTHVNGYQLRTFTWAGRTIVTWRRSGHTCVLSALGVPASTLWRLAGWRGPGVGA